MSASARTSGNSSPQGAPTSRFSSSPSSSSSCSAASAINRTHGGPMVESWENGIAVINLCLSSPETSPRENWSSSEKEKYSDRSERIVEHTARPITARENEPFKTRREITSSLRSAAATPVVSMTSADLMSETPSSSLLVIQSMIGTKRLHSEEKTHENDVAGANQNFTPNIDDNCNSIKSTRINSSGNGPAHSITQKASLIIGAVKEVLVAKVSESLEVALGSSARGAVAVPADTAPSALSAAVSVQLDEKEEEEEELSPLVYYFHTENLDGHSD